jgi:hypothetical protein
VAKLDASINDYTATELLADRADAYRLAVKLLKEAGFLMEEIAPEDALLLVHFLSNDIY